MEMQDKEFDELFLSKLDDFEVEPSAGVWTGIAGELAAGKRKKYLFPLLSIAASILILVAAGILFIPHYVKISGKKPFQNRITKTMRPTNTNIPTKSGLNPVSSKSSHKTSLNETAIAVNNKAGLHPTKATGYSQTTLVTEHAPALENTVKTDNQPILASVAQKQPEAIKAVVPDESTELTIKQQPVEETTLLTTKPALITAQIPAVTKQGAAPLKPKHKIHSLGDFLNVVVATVDKRQDKIIEFSDTDDDGSTVTGVNLGIFKIKKEK